MKVIQNERSIQRERKFIQAMAGLNHSHLVKCLAGWTYDSKFYMIYELASCNLEEFMQDRMESHQPRGIAESMFVKQLCGLAAALRVIHCQGEDSEISKDTYLGVPRSDNKKTGYIHDLKPENILVFMSSETVQSFRISDFSCAKVVDFVASVSGKRRSHLTTSKSGTPIYRAPESMGGATSRPYDLWSLGCVYLELLVWFFDGYRALEVFRNERVELVHPHGAEDEGFYSMIDEGPDAKMRLRKPVLNKIEELSARSGGSLKEIVNIIPDLLKIAPEERLTATALVKKLRELNTGADLTFPSPSTTALLAPAPMTLPAPAEESDIEPNGFVVVEDYS
ncbi:kinase-like domain-containing protein [Massariosphaeria phaeospora]|uniref:Kinase-like domain-containing protein n=1 Tax=Massariosphaeria phaeospora TaxID=100035 RepID=A0A7C8IB10_9PLEO|nr:kinase-like domain-containing protein [Massariosphaeria phaeospora]